jgi:ferritin-like metal-binding protein YciE
MATVSLKDLYFDELGDLCDVEDHLTRALSRLAEAAKAPELREALTRHSQESRLHRERLELIFTHWGQPLRPRPCKAFAAIVEEADERLSALSAESAIDTAIIGAAHRIEHYKIAAYESARAYARRLNRTDEARLLQETLEEESRADRGLAHIAEAQIAPQAGRAGHADTEVGFSSI